LTPKRPVSKASPACNSTPFTPRCSPSDSTATVDHLWRFLGQQWEQLHLSGYAAEAERYLRKQGGLMLFDGLDEVPEAHDRRTQIKQVVETFVNL
jgi:hypothetical protein